MSARDAAEYQRLLAALIACEASGLSLPGISAPERRETFVKQLVESEHRSWYVEHLLQMTISPHRADPTSTLFDPLKASILQHRWGNLDEAYWMVFLYVHFGKHRRAGWRYARDVYGRLGNGRWAWTAVSSDVGAFRTWLAANQAALEYAGPNGFGNHRKYESLDGWSAAGTGAVVASYVAWVRASGDHEVLMRSAVEVAKGDPKVAFDSLYRSMDSVHRFGRTARFDYLSMVGKLGLAPIAPGKATVIGATGPLTASSAGGKSKSKPLAKSSTKGRSTG